MTETGTLLEQLTGKKQGTEQNVEISAAAVESQWSFDSLEHIAHSPQNILNVQNKNNFDFDNILVEDFGYFQAQQQVTKTSEFDGNNDGNNVLNSKSFEVSNLLGVLKTTNQVAQHQQQFQQQSQSQDNIQRTVLENNTHQAEFSNQHVQENVQHIDNYQVSDLLVALQDPEHEHIQEIKNSSVQGSTRTFIKEKIQNSPLRQKFGNTVAQQTRKKTWGDISAEKRPNDRRKYHIIGDTSHLLEEEAFPSLGGATSQHPQISIEPPQKNIGVWSKQKPQPNYLQSKKIPGKDLNTVEKQPETAFTGVDSIIQKLKLQFKSIPENIIRCIVESVQFDVGIAQQILREMEFENEIQESSESEVENATPQPHPRSHPRPHPSPSFESPQYNSDEDHQNLYRKYRKQALQFSKEAKQFRRRAWRAFRNGSQVEGEGLIRNAAEKHVLAKKEHEKAAKKIFSEVNFGYQDNPWKMDLHGLFPDEAVDVVTERINFLQEFSVYDRNKQPLEIITGRGRHTADGESILSIVIDNLLRGQPYQHTVKDGSILLWMGRKRTFVNS